MQTRIKAADRSVIRVYAVLIIVSITLCACAGGNPYPPLVIGSIFSAMEPKQFPVEDLEPTASLGVVSLLSDELHLRYDGLTVFQNRNHKDKVPQWNIDERLSRAVAMVLARRGTHRVGVMANNGMIDPVTGRVSTYTLLERAEKHQFDIVVIIRPFVPHKSHYWDSGYGLWGSSKWRSAQSHCAYSWVIVDVWDIDTKDKIGYQHSRTCDRDETIEVKDQLADYSPTEQARIERLVRNSLFQSVVSALRNLGL